MNTSDLVRCCYEEIWTCGNKARIPELLHESFAFRGSLGQTKPRHGFDYVLQRLRSNEEFRSASSITVGSKGNHLKNSWIVLNPVEISRWPDTHTWSYWPGSEHLSHMLVLDDTGRRAASRRSSVLSCAPTK